MKKYFIPLIFLLLLFGCTGSKPSLKVSFLPVSQLHPYEGDQVTLTVTVSNTGAAEAKDFTVEIIANNNSLKTDVMTLVPNANQTESVSWYPYSAGDYNVVVRVDSGNSVSDASPDKEASMQISVLPAEKVSMFSALPSSSLLNVGVINATKSGLVALYTYMPTMQELSGSAYLSFLRPYIQNLKDVQIGTVDYNSQQHGIVVFIKGPATVEQVSSILSSFIKMTSNVDSTVQSEDINGTNVSVITSNALPSSVCIWREKGLLKITSFIDSATLETCDTMFGARDASYAENPLSVKNSIAGSPPFSTTLLGETLHVANITGTTITEYGAAFSDNEGFYGLYVTKQPYNETQNNTCYGRIMNNSMEQVCEATSVNATWAVVQRRIGDYTMACFSTPKTGNLTVEIENKALDFCYALNYSGQERTWSRPELLHPAGCNFPDGFICPSYDYSNSTLTLNLTQNTGKTVVINGFKCSWETSPTNLQLTKPIVLNSNSTIHIRVPCYNETGSQLTQEYVYFSSFLYMNYSFEGSNDSKLITGNLTVRKI